MKKLIILLIVITSIPCIAQDSLVYLRKNTAIFYYKKAKEAEFLTHRVKLLESINRTHEETIKKLSVKVKLHEKESTILSNLITVESKKTDFYIKERDFYKSKFKKVRNQRNAIIGSIVTIVTAFVIF